MSSINRNVYTNHPNATTTLRVIAYIAGIPLSSSKTKSLPSSSSISFNDINNDNDVKFIMEMKVVCRNGLCTLNNNSSPSWEYSTIGMTGCLRSICRSNPESGLWGEWDSNSGYGGNSNGNIIAAQIEGWIETAVNVLCHPAYVVDTKRVNHPHYKSVISNFVQILERHLYEKSFTFLTGDRITAADIVISILLSHAISRIATAPIADEGGKTKAATFMPLPQQVYRWMGTILSNRIVMDAIANTITSSDDESPAIMMKVDGLVLGRLSEPTLVKKKNKEEVGNKKKNGSNDKNLVEKGKEGKKVKHETKKEDNEKKVVNAVTTKEQKVEAPKKTIVENNSKSGDIPTEILDNIVLQKLDSLSIPHRTYRHAACITAEELQSNVPLTNNDTHTKNLFLRDKKHGLFLVSVRPEAHVDTKDLGKKLGLTGRINLRLADEKILIESLGVKKGCVGPLCIINATTSADGGDGTKASVTLVLDEQLFSKDVTMIHSHPLTNDASTALLPTDLQKYLKGVGVEPILLPFGSKTESVTSTPPVSSSATKASSTPAPPQVLKAKQSKTEKAQQQQQGGKGKGKGKGKEQQGNNGQMTKVAKTNKKTAKKGETLLALQWKKDENFPMWYSDVIVLSEMISYYDISGCYILRPWSYKMWELIQDWLNAKISKLGVENSYFPLFVSKDRLEKEKDHVEGFAPEVAWVTKSGDGDLAQPIAVRPTSETIMYPAYSDWIKSHRDLPLKLNQWSNVVRWEFKDPTPFLRSREFLWQEGHTAHANHKEADEMVMSALELYRGVYEDLMAVPVIPGYKTEKEKFAGGKRTTTVEAYIAGSGRAIQGATSHDLGQNFGEMFDITFQDEDGCSKTAWQTSWGLTTRTIGVMVMVHGDDIGLVLPPLLAPLQAVIVPIISKKLSHETADPYCEAILKQLTDSQIRAKYDDRTEYNPGWKYNHWEQKGVPIRIEVGPRDMENKQVRVVLRYNGEKTDMSIDGIGDALKLKLAEIQVAMFKKAKAARDEHLAEVTEWKDFVPNLEKNNLVMTPWCGGDHTDWEEWVKNKSREESLLVRGEGEEDERAATSVAAKTLCIPFKQPELPAGTMCIASGLPATCWVLWGRSY